ncbi:DUF3106 domain-containing protein [Porticoccaceae bacterium]|jgi:hypothetical protein|nr:DUF3106 domain-containing protein [Porticoccaceae bacterium]
MKSNQLRMLALTAALTCATLPAYADDRDDAIAWRDLPADTREVLAPIAERWDTLKPRQQHRLVRKVADKTYKHSADRWKSLSPEERQRIKQGRERFKDMPEEKRKELRQRWQNMSEEERREAVKARRVLRHYPPEERHILLEELRKLPPEERREQLKKLKKKQPERHD